MTDLLLLSSLSALGEHLAAHAVERSLVLTGDSRRHLHLLEAVLGAGARHVFDGAQVHVPMAVVQAARAVLDEVRPQRVISLGGGAATGLAKALRRDHDFHFVAVPTTYSASEMTEIWGVTDGAHKQTGRDPRVRPDVVVHDASLTLDMPLRLTLHSLLNTIAQPVSALSTGSLQGEAKTRALDAIGRGLRAAERLAVQPRDEQARRQALLVTAEAGRALAAGVMGPHHKLAHLLGGRFLLDHAAVHAVLLPRTLAWLKTTQPALLDEISAACDGGEPMARIHELLALAGGPLSLSEMGVERAALTEALADFSGPSSIAEDAFSPGERAPRRSR